MMILDSIKAFINKTDLKTFYYYIMGYGGVCCALFAGMVIFYYSSIGSLKKSIANVNDSREEVLAIFEEYAKIKQQQAAVEEILAKDPNFKIQGEFKILLEKLRLKDKEAPEEVINTIDLEDNYRKNELSANFDGMTMQELTKLLEEIEQNPRIATERLSISASKKKPHTIEVALTISTLLPKVENTAT